MQAKVLKAFFTSLLGWDLDFVRRTLAGINERKRKGRLSTCGTAASISYDTMAFAFTVALLRLESPLRLELFGGLVLI